MSKAYRRLLTYFLAASGLAALVVTWLFMEPTPWRIPAVILGFPYVVFILIGLFGYPGNLKTMKNAAAFFIPSYLTSAFVDDKNSGSI